MKRHHNTLYVTSQGAYVAAEGENLLVRVESETRFRVPVHMLEGLVCFGRVSVSPGAMRLSSERGIGVSFLTERGRFIARLQGPTSGNVLLRRAQYRAAEPDGISAKLAQAFVLAKVANSRAAILRSLRDHPSADGRTAMERASTTLAMVLDDVERSTDLDAIRGFEGEAARVYYGVFDHLVVAQKDAFRFEGRTRRPPLDRLNALLSFVYVLLTHDAASALESVGLDPQVGFLHRDRPGRPGLALDLVEEFRPFLADRLVLSLVNRKQIEPGGFATGGTGGVSMDDATRKTILVAYQERKQEEIKHPFLGDTTTVGMLVHLQALLLARFLRGDLDAYPSFFWR